MLPRVGFSWTRALLQTGPAANQDAPVPSTWTRLEKGVQSWHWDVSTCLLILGKACCSGPPTG
jgi:hypothetical protein